jgi:hypothetical protein
MSRSSDRAFLSRLVDAYDQIAEESLGMGDPEFHEIEDQLFDAIDDSGYRTGGSGRSHRPELRRGLRGASSAPTP